MPSHDDFQALVNRVHHAATERLATMALYRAVDAWCALKQRSPVQLLSLHVSNTSSPWLKRRTYTVQTSSPSTVHAALCAILPECFECIPAAHRMEGSHSPASPSSDDDWAWNHPLLLKLATLAAALRAAGKSYREIAEEMDVSTGVVGHLLHEHRKRAGQQQPGRGRSAYLCRPPGTTAD